MGSITDASQNISNDEWFTKIDLSKGYWQVPVAEKNISKTAFATPDKMYEFSRIPFGMVNSSATNARSDKETVGGNAEFG